MREKKTTMKEILEPALACAVIGAIVAVTAPLLRFSGQTMQPVPDVHPVYEVTATWGSFDEIRLFRYYTLEDVPDIEDVPKKNTEYHGTEYTFVGVDGPVKIEFGECWEAMYREEEQK